jgi:hypothetical protein
VLGVVHAFGELRPALVRRGDELRENGGALDDIRAFLMRVKNFSLRGCIRRPTGDPPGPTYRRKPLREEVVRPQRTVSGNGEYPLLSTSII